jgi:hypothetical protein
MGKISAIQVPNLNPSLVHNLPSYNTSGGGGQRFLHPSPAGGGEPLSQAFHVNRMLVKIPRFVLKFRYSGGKTPLIIVTHVCHCVSDSAPLKMALPRGGA